MMTRSPSGLTEALAMDRADVRVRFPQGLAHDQTGLQVAQYVPTPERQIWRVDASRSGMPRALTLGSAGCQPVYVWCERLSVTTQALRSSAIVRRMFAGVCSSDWNAEIKRRPIVDI
jgi:hypothetical protein